MIRDVRYGLRVLRNSPGFTAVAVLALALGIGANSAIFSVVNAVVFRPLPYSGPDRIAVILESNLQRTWDTAPVAPGNFIDWREQQRTFSHFAAYRGSDFLLTGGEEPERIRAARVTADFFAVLGMAPVAGRAFAPEEFAPGRDHVVILSHELWQRRFASAREIIGQAIRINSNPYVVVGVMPPGFQGPGRHELWSPLSLTAKDAGDRNTHSLFVYGRLKPGIGLKQAETEMKAIALRAEQKYPETNTGFGVVVRSLQEDVVGPVRPAMLLLLGAVGLVLLIACANVANLLLARASARSKEIAVRAALGAAQWRIVRQLLIESVLLSTLGGALGLLLAFWAVRAISNLRLEAIPRMGEIGIDPAVLAFTTLLSAGTGVIFGIAPALQALRLDLNSTLKTGGRSGSGGGNVLRSVLVIVEITLAVVLLSGAGLLLKSFVRLAAVDPGFKPEQIVLVETALPRGSYSQAEKQEAFYRRWIERVSEIPGIKAAAGATTVPFGTADLVHTYHIVGQARRSPAESPSSNFYAVTPEYFRALGIPLRHGRYFGERDGESGPAVAIVNETFARRSWPGENPVGRYLIVDHSDSTPRQVVGVVGDIKHYGLNEASTAEVYEPFRQKPYAYLTLVLKIDGRAEGVTRAAGRMAHELEPDIPLYNVRTMEQQISGSISQLRLAMALLAIFAGLALLLAALGAYGVLSFTVSQRTQELGLRMALGAQPWDVLRLVLKQGMSLAVAGIASGLVAAAALGRVMASQIYGVSSTDPAIYGAVTATLLLAALLACLVPARRAMQVDPLISIRHE